MIPALILAVAVTLSGEAGPLGPEAELAVAKTMANRMADDRWPSDLGGVLDAYYGRGTPTATALTYAALLVSAPNVLASEEGYLYVYSDADRARMGWAKGDEMYCGRGLCLHCHESGGGGDA